MWMSFTTLASPYSLVTMWFFQSICAKLSLSQVYVSNLINKSNFFQSVSLILRMKIAIISNNMYLL